jgi:hypothetical protein
MAEGISQHKRMAMGESVPTAKGKGSLPKFAGGGAVMAESKVANLPAKGEVMPMIKGSGEKIATYKKGGRTRRDDSLPSRKPIGLTIAVGIPVKKVGRSR